MARPAWPCDFRPCLMVEPSGSELVRLRKLAKELAEQRGETVTTVHLLAAVWHRGGVARELLDARRLDAAAVLKAARSFDEQTEAPLTDALTAARELAHRSAVPSQASFPSSRRGAARPRAAAEPSGIHVLVVLLSNRRLAAHRALAQCGVDIGRLRSAATRVALGVVAEPRLRRAVRREQEGQEGGATPETTDVAERTGTSEKARGRVTPSRPPRGRAVQVPWIPAPPATPWDKPKSVVPHGQPPDACGDGVDDDLDERHITTALELVEGVADRAATTDDEPLGLALTRERYPVLSELGRNLTLAAVRGEIDEVIGRDAEIERALDVLAKRHANNVLLVGPAGVGKTSVARGLALAFAKGANDDDARLLIEIPVSELLAGTGARGSLAERMAAIRHELKQASGRVVLFIDEIHELLGSAGAEEVMGELKAALAMGELPLVAATTTEDFRRTVDSDAALARRFSVIEVDEPDEEDAFLLLRAVAAGLSRHHRVGYSDEAIATAVAWSKRYLPGRALPDKAVAILDLAGARARRRGLASSEVGLSQVAEIVCELAEVPLERLLETDRERMLHLDRLLMERIVGHDEACERIAQVLRRNAVGLRGKRPIGTLLLLGPTGVGKTETAKAIAEVLFHSRDAMTRLDMSEYAEPHAVARLIGAPPGYVGHEAGGLLTEAVKVRPYQVVLLDEIEKAHRDVLQAFLQVFDEGRLTDGRGRTVDCTNTVLIMTSNLGARELDAAVHERPLGFGARSSAPKEGAMRDIAVKAARALLPPELYNRIDEVIFFRHLDERDMRAIARRLLAALGESLEIRGVKLEVDDAAIGVLMERGGFDPRLGARPMRRAIARLVEAPLAEMILEGDLEEGAVAMLTVENGELVVDAVGGRKKRAAEPA